MPTTSNFGWTTPADTDLVKNGALAIRTLGNGIDTSLVDLKGGTTGQVLSKNSNTDMDFTWVAQDDSNAIQNAIVDAKGDLISATAADTPARLAVGTDGQILTADSTTATGLKWAAAPSSTPTFAGCFLTKSTNQSINTATHSAVTFDVEELDTDAYHSTSSNTSRITIPSGKGGKYLIIGQISYTANATGGRYLIIKKNNTTDLGQTIIPAEDATYQLSVTGQYIADLAVGDYIELIAYQDSGTSLNALSTGNGPAYCRFAVTYLGA